MGRRGVIHVFDASALVAYAKRESGAERVEPLLLDETGARIVHAVNLCEVYYHFLRRHDQRRGDTTLQSFLAAGLTTREDMDGGFWRSVARVKSDIPQASLGDCFAIALAARVGGTVVTADHPGFETAASLGICPVAFIR
jgi:PIN domain nuclease of toxin-antitoxin system